MARSWLLTISLALVAFVVNAQELPNDKVDQVRERLAESAALRCVFLKVFTAIHVADLRHVV